VPTIDRLSGLDAASSISTAADAAVVPDTADLARDLVTAFDALRVVPRLADTPWRARARSRRQRAARR
jgi:hypothetical protein